MPEAVVNENPLLEYGLLYQNEFVSVIKINDNVTMGIRTDKFIVIIAYDSWVFSHTILDIETTDDRIRLINEVRGYYDHYQVGDESITNYLDARFYLS